MSLPGRPRPRSPSWKNPGRAGMIGTRAGTTGRDPNAGGERDPMAGDASSTALRHVESLFRDGTAAGLTDGQLLGRFADDPGGPSAESAFAALVDRHGAMVLRVCRQVLGDEHEAQDASQATFLVLAQRAGSIARRDSVGS